MNTPTVNLSELGANLSQMIEKIMDELDDAHLNTLVKKRLTGRRIHVNLRDL